MEDTDTANQADAVDTPESTDATDTGADTEVQVEQQFDENGDPIEDNSQVEEEDEIDLDDETKLKLPKSQAEKLRLAMLRQEDYSRKTMELAEQRKAFETERQAITQADEQELSARANLTLIDQQISQYAKVNWNAWNEEDPFAAQKAFQQYQLLKDAKSETTNYLSTLKDQRTAQEQQATAKRLSEGRETIVKAIPDWSPTYSAKLFDDAKTHFGLTSEDLEGIDDPRAIIILNAAVKGLALQNGQKKAQAVQQQQKIVPAAKAAGGGNPVPPGKLDDRLSADEWVRRRNAQVAKAGGR